MRKTALSVACQQVAIIACLLLLTACGTSRDPAVGVKPPAGVPQQPRPVSDLPGWLEDDLADLDQALRRQCDTRRPPGPWAGLCSEFNRLPPRSTDALRDWLERRFVAQALGGPTGSTDASSATKERAGPPRGLITGYYEPLIQGSRQRRSADQVPIYAPPRDLLTIELASIEPRLSGMRLRGRAAARSCMSPAPARP